MGTTPLWLTLVLAALSPASALIGVWLTQRHADRREDATFARELAREQSRWQREDEQLTFEYRRTAYADFYESLRRMMLRAYDHGLGLSDGDDELPEGWQTDAFERLQHLELYASPQVALVASEAYGATWRWGHATRHGRDDDTFYGNQNAADDGQANLIAAIRADLKIPDRPDIDWATDRQ